MRNLHVVLLQTITKDLENFSRTLVPMIEYRQRKLGTVTELTLEHCDNVQDISALHSVKSLSIMWCEWLKILPFSHNLKCFKS